MSSGLFSRKKIYNKQKAVLIAHEAFVSEEYLVEDRTVVGYLVVFHVKPNKETLMEIFLKFEH